MVTWTLSPTVKRPGREADRSMYIWSRIRTSTALPPLPHIPSWHEEGPLYPRPYLNLRQIFLSDPFLSGSWTNICTNFSFLLTCHHTMSVSLKWQPNNRIFGQQHKLWRSFIMEHLLTSRYTKDTQHTTQHSTQHATTDRWGVSFWPTTV